MATFFFVVFIYGLLATVSAVELAPDRELSKLKFKPQSFLNANPGSKVNDIIQGPNGFIWFGTREGAHRFDGYELQTFANEKRHPDSLVNSVTLVFHVDQNSRIWIGTEKGLSYFIPETETFRNFILDPSEFNSNLANHTNAIVRDSNDRLYVSSESGYVYLYDENKDGFDRINDTQMGIIKSMAMDFQDRIWVGSDSHLYRFDPKTLKIETFSEPFIPKDPTVANFIESICYVNDETIWLATASDGAVLFNSVTGEVDVVPAVVGGENYAHVIKQDDAGNIWIGHSGGLTLYEKESGEVTRYTSEQGPEPLPDSGVHSMLLDKQGNIWVGTAYHGIYVSSNDKLFNRLARYQSRNDSSRAIISSLMQDKSGNLWVGQNSSGVDIFPPDGGEVIELRNDPNDPSSISLNTVFEIHQDSVGEIWLGIYRGGLHRFIPETLSFKHYVHDVTDPLSLSGNDVRAIQEDEKGNLWILTHGQGLSYFDRSTEKFTSIRKDPGDQDRTLIDDWANDILYQDGGLLFVGTAIGLSVLDTETGIFQNYESDPDDPNSLSNSVINAIREDSKDRIWLGTSDGLSLFDFENGSFRNWSVEEGLPNRVVSSIVFDEEGGLWLGTENGLAYFDPETGKVDSYDELDGISSNAFYARAALKVDDGRLFFGTTNGVTFFDPAEIVDNKYVPEVWINEFKVFNKSLGVDPTRGGHGALESSILETKRIVLDHDQKVISIGYVALNFIQSSKNRYAYRLVGFDEGWNYVGTRREATYTNLNPGQYMFQVKASNNDGYWNETPRELEIVIQPPFWDTIGFKVLALLLIVSVPTAWFFGRLHRIKVQKEVLEKTVGKRTEDLIQANLAIEQAYTQLAENQSQIKVQNRELIKHRENLETMVVQRTQELETAKHKAEKSDLLKSAFLANMSHEIRTPMNAIIGLLEILRIDTLTEEEREQYTEVIKQSSGTLMTLIDDILDLSRIESGEANIQLQVCNCDEICEELFALYRHVASRESDGKIELKLIRNHAESSKRPGDGDLNLPGLDPIRLKQILTNLLSNAIKFTDAGEIRFGYEAAEEIGETCIRFFVTDTGIGIRAGETERVFDRFHKLDSRSGRVYRGTGLGLTISKRLTEMMDGQISVESEEGEGATFFVEFVRKTGNQGRFERKSGNVGDRTNDQLNFRGVLNGVQILVAEDEEPNYLVLQKYLEPTGAVLFWVKDGLECIAAFDEQEFDVVLLDLKLPRKDGYEVLTHIRSLNTEVKVVVQTAYAMEKDQVKVKALGASAFLSKPFSQERLVSEIEDLLGLRG